MTADAALAALADHTLVIPTYNRPALLRQVVAYYLGRTPDMQMLVLDSSKPEIAEENRIALAGLKGNLRHILYDTRTPMARKLALGLAEVATPSASFCADDDIVFPAGLSEAVEFLRGHPDYVTAHGLYLNFQESGDTIRLTREYAGPGNEAGHAGARIYRLCQSYESLFYGAFRTQDLRDIFNEVADLPTLHYQELFQSCAALIKGKVKRLPVFYAARRSGPAAEPDRDKWQTYYWFADNPGELMQHYLAYRERVRLFYERFGARPGLPAADFDRAMDLAHMVYFSRGCPPAYFHDRLQAYWPSDRFEKVDEIDLFQQMRVAGPARAAGSVQRGYLWLRRTIRKLRLRKTETATVALNASTAARFKTPWVCSLSYGMAWLAGHEGFRQAYDELCAYLDVGRGG